MVLVDSSVLIDFFRGRDTPAVRRLEEIPLDPVAAHVEAARIFYDCRRRGLTVRSSTDCLIAALALEQGHTLLHDDADFDTIARVRPLRTSRG